jgi:DNA-binding response OmpR family regulator
MRLCVIEDNTALRQAMAHALTERGFEVFEAADASELQEVLRNHQPDVFVIDIELPGENGWSITERMKKAYPQSFIAMVTARGKIEDRVRGYELGADLYLVKPINLKELVAAIHAARRRLDMDHAHSASFLLFMHEMILSAAGRVSVVALTPSECQLLKALIEAPNGQLEYWELMELLGKKATDESRRILEVHMVNLRNKLRRLGAEGQVIRAARGIGYRLLVDAAIAP